MLHWHSPRPAGLPHLETQEDLFVLFLLVVAGCFLVAGRFVVDVDIFSIFVEFIAPGGEQKSSFLEFFLSPQSTSLFCMEVLSTLLSRFSLVAHQ